MRTRVIVLLAVCSNVAVAGIIRRNEVRVQHHNVARFLNHTSIASIPASIPTLTPLPIPFSIIPSVTASPETSSLATSSSIIPAVTSLAPEVTSSISTPADLLTKSALTQASSTSVPDSTTVPAGSIAGSLEVGNAATSVSTEATDVQPAETLSRLFNLAGGSSNNLQTSSSAQSLPISSSSKSNALLSTTSGAISTASVQENAAMSSSSSVVGGESSILESPLTNTPAADASRYMSVSTDPVLSSSTEASSQASSPVIVSMPTSSTGSSGQASSPVVVPVPVSTGPVQVLGAGGDTTDEFAPIILDTSLSAPTGTASYPTAGNGNIAMATGFNNVYKTLNENTPCNPGDPSQAYACVEGEIAECQSDQTYVLKSCPRGQSCYALPKPSGLTGVVVQCAVPSDAYDILAGSASSIAVSTTIVSQSAQQTIQAEVFSTQPTYSVSAQNSVQPAPFSLSVQPTTLSPIIVSASPVQAVIATTSLAENSDQLHTSAVATSMTPTAVQSVFQAQSQTLGSPSPATTTAQQVQDSNRLQDSPKSFSSSSLPSTTADILSIPKAIFAVVTATGGGGQTSHTSPEIATPVAQSSATFAQADSGSLQPTETNIISTSTSSADDGSTTFAPERVPVNEKLAVGNGQVTVTVTVTVTTTERPAPVTVIAS